MIKYKDEKQRWKVCVCVCVCVCLCVGFDNWYCSFIRRTYDTKQDGFQLGSSVD